jgi:amidohydrolase
MLLQKIKQLAAQYAQEFIEIRQHLHANPELSYQEYNTSTFIQNKLTSLGIEFTIMATTGVVAIIKGNNSTSRVIALRADMDALPIVEENEVPYKSKNIGVMHACGHDVHTSCLLGAAKILNELKNDWEGTVKLIFQLGEEKNPGGASLMIKEGVLKNPTPTNIIGLHVHNGLQVGKLSFREGKVMASADEIYITISSNGGHAAAPHLTVDTILVASHLIIALQHIISRNNNPTSPSVLTISSINGGNATNVIPSQVKLMGTFRAMDETWRYKAHELIKKQATAIVEGFGATLDLKIDIGYPTVFNDPSFTKKCWQLGNDFMGENNVEETEIRMGAEDFGFYAQKIPACFFRLGIRNEEKQIIHGMHTPKFNIDENAIEIGIGAMAWLGAMG